MRIYRLLPRERMSRWYAYVDNGPGTVYDGLRAGDSIIPITARPSGRDFWFALAPGRGWYLHLKSGAIVNAHDTAVEEV